MELTFNEAEADQLRMWAVQRADEGEISQRADEKIGELIAKKLWEEVDG